MQSAASVMARARPASTFVQIPPDDGQAAAIRQPASRIILFAVYFIKKPGPSLRSTAARQRWFRWRYAVRALRDPDRDDVFQSFLLQYSSASTVRPAFKANIRRDDRCKRVVLPSIGSRLSSLAGSRPATRVETWLQGEPNIAFGDRRRLSLLDYDNDAFDTISRRLKSMR
jgi:hypothetical protein